MNVYAKFMKRKQHYFFVTLFWLTIALSIYQPFFLITVPVLFFMAIDKTESLKAALPFLIWIYFFPIAFHFRFLRLEQSPEAEYATVYFLNNKLDSWFFNYGISAITLLTLLYFYLISLRPQEKGNPDNYKPLPFKPRISPIVCLISLVLFIVTTPLATTNLDPTTMTARIVNMFYYSDNLNEERQLILILISIITFNFLVIRYLLILNIEKIRRTRI